MNDDLARSIDVNFASVLATLWRQSSGILLPNTMAFLEWMLEERSAANAHR